MPETKPKSSDNEAMDFHYGGTKPTFPSIYKAEAINNLPETTPASDGLLEEEEMSSIMERFKNDNSPFALLELVKMLRIAQQAKTRGEFDLKFNPDYLKFQDGVEAGRKLERAEHQAEKEAFIDIIDPYLLMLAGGWWQSLKAKFLEEK